MVTAAEKAELDVLHELDSRPSAPARVVRSTGQGGFAYVLLDAAQAFGWADIDQWTPDQVKAAMALTFATIAAVQNFGPSVLAVVSAWWNRRQGAG